MKIDIIPSATAKYSSKATAPYGITGFTFVWNTKGNSTKRDYDYSADTTNNKFVSIFSSMSGNTNSKTADTRVKVYVTEFPSASGMVFFSELKNEITGYDLSITWDGNFHSTMT